MHQLPDPAIEAILKEWNPQEYVPPNTDIREWIRTIESLCNTYGIPDTQRPQCAARFVKRGLRPQLERALKNARAKFGPILWTQFANFMVALDYKFQEWEELPFYRKYSSQLGGTALLLTGAALLAPVALSGALTFASTAGRAAATTRTIVAGVVAAGAGIGMLGNDESIINEILADSIARGPQPGGVSGGDESDDPPPYSEVNPDEYLLKPRALQAIAKSWEITPYDTFETFVPYWLYRLNNFCELYGVPVTQRTQCAMHHMGTNREAANAAGCHDMTWDQFRMWLLKYDAKGKAYLYLHAIMFVAIFGIVIVIR